MTEPSQDGRIDLTTGSGPDPTSAHPLLPASTEPHPLFRAHRTNADSTPARTDPRRSQRQPIPNRSIGVAIPRDRRSVPARAFRCRTARLAPTALHDRTKCYCGMPAVPSGALSRLPETLTSGETQGPGGRDFGPAQPHRRAQDQRPPPSTHPFGATSNRSSRTTRTGESAIGPSSDRRDRDPHCPARKPATSPAKLNQRQRQTQSSPAGSCHRYEPVRQGDGSAGHGSTAGRPNRTRRRTTVRSNRTTRPPRHRLAPA